MMMMYAWVAAVTAVLDQSVKIYIRSIPQGQTFFEIPGLLALTHCINTGAAFSLLSGKMLLLTVLSVALIVLLCFYAHSRMQLTVSARMALSVLIGGGVGNLIDRVLFGGVTDYFRLLVIDFPVFNLADMAITGSILLLMILIFTDSLEESAEENYGPVD